MTGKARSITDKKLFYTIFSKLFINKHVFLKKNDAAVAVQFIDYTEGIATLKIPPGNEPFDHVIVYTNRQDDVVFSHMKFENKISSNVYAFRTSDLQILGIPRHETRYPVAAPENQVKRSEPRLSQLYVSNIISDFTLSKCLGDNTRRVEYIRQELSKKMMPSYPFPSIKFINELKNDPRMLFFQDERRPYFIPKFESGDMPDSDQDLKKFMSQIYPHDREMGHERFSSEIAVPMLYKFMLPFGYIQVNEKRQLTGDDYSLIRKIGMSASTIFTNDPHIIKSGQEIVPIVDLSINGLGIIFREKPLIKHFRDKSSIVFNIFLPEKKQATVLAAVRYISDIRTSRVPLSGAKFSTSIR